MMLSRCAFGVIIGISSKNELSISAVSDRGPPLSGGFRKKGFSAE